MNNGLRRILGLIVLAAGWVVLAHCQQPEEHLTSASDLVSSTVSSPGEQPVTGVVIREIADPHTGDRWLLIQDTSHPGAPGRMVLASAGTGAFEQRYPKKASLAVLPATAHEPSIPVIHSGDRLIVEENTKRVETRLEAVALGQAAIGAPLNVRLAIGGNLVRAVALGPGRAAFAQTVGIRP